MKNTVYWFCSIPVAVVWPRRTSAVAARFLLRYQAVLVLALGLSWTYAVASGQGSDLGVTGAISLTLLAAIIAVSAPTRRLSMGLR